MENIISLDAVAMMASVENIKGRKSAAAFMTPSAKVFREDLNISAQSLGDKGKYMPWGGNNLMPFEILDLIERDETLATCQSFNAEVTYGAGLSYDTSEAVPTTADEVDDFIADNDFPGYYLGTALDINFFGFAVSLVVLNKSNTKILRIERKEAMYCRFAEADENGDIPYVYYANWRKAVVPEKVQRYPLLNPMSPLSDLRDRLQRPGAPSVYAVVCRVPTVDSTYYPIPHYAALFRGKWYDIKQLIGIAKEAKLKNSAPIKYHIEISAKYWENIFRSEGITNPVKQKERIVNEKKNILDFLTGAENSGKAWFSMFYISPDGHEQHDVKITKIDDSKEGGDWQTDIQEAINMICFTMRVHSNLVGSVPGKSQSNNSGSDKRELYTIAQALKTPYRDIMFKVHRLVIRFNGWKKVIPFCPFIQLTTLDEHRDSKPVISNIGFK